MNDILSKGKLWMMLDIDQAVRAAFNDHTVPGYSLFFYGITLLGSAYLWVAVLMICLLIGRWKKIAVILIITIIFGMIVNEDIKDIVGRIRPDNVMVGSYFSIHNYSFPSGHTQTAFLIATVLSAFIAWRYRPAVYLMAAAVGVSRLYLGFHYFTDTVAGAAAGILLGVMAIYGLHRLGLLNRDKKHGIVPCQMRKLAGNRWHDADLIKFTAIVIAAGFIASFAAVLLSQYFLSLAAIGVMYILLLLLPSFLKGRLHTNIRSN